MTTRVGTHLDRYEIDAELGRGAVGVVYRARDLKLDRTVAIKMIPLFGLEPDAEQEYRKRFVVEARAAGRLSHAGIVTVYDVREEAETGAPYLVMEYIEGQSLQKLLNRENRTLPLSTTLYLVQEVAEALHYAHAQGVVHRDIKPANILVDAYGHAKIADFGIAKLNHTDVTLPGQVLGSPAYMAPEQLRDEGVDARSDLFSLGVILYYMLTGHKPFQGNSTTTVCYKLVNHEPLPVSAFESKFSAELDNIVSRAIAKDPAHRYQSGLAMASDIERLRETSGFINRRDWTIRSLKRDAIPRYVSGPPEARPKEIAPVDEGLKSLNRLVPGSGIAIEDNKAVHIRGSRFSWNPLLLYGLLAIAMGSVIFWSLHRRARVQLPPAPIPVSSVPANATLQVEIEHHFTNALASIWLDNVLVYTQSLQRGKTPRAPLFRNVVDHQFEVIRVPMGKHELRVRIQSAIDSYDQSKTIVDAFIQNQSKLRIVCFKKRSELQLSLQ